MKVFLGSQVENQYVIIIQRNDGVTRANIRSLTKSHYLSLKAIEGMKREGTNYRILEIKEL